MSATESLRQVLASTQIYLDLLKTFSTDDFQLQPSPSGWSYSEVYSHIIHVNTFSLMAVERCLHGKQSTLAYRLPFTSRLILFLGRFPRRLKAPERIASAVKKISLEDARNGLIKIKHRLEEIFPKLTKASSSCRVTHPRLGMLNSEQWLRFMEIHNNHHLKQIERIGKMLKKQLIGKAS